MAERDFKELLDIINKTVESIGKLETKITSLQKEMSSGNYGTFQLKQFNDEVEKLQANLSRKKTSLSSLVDEKELRESTKDFDTLNKQIDTLQKNIASGKGFLGLFKTDDPQYQKLITQIKNAESALKSFEARKYTQFNALGQRKDSTLGSVNLEERLTHGVPPGGALGAVSIRESDSARRKVVEEFNNILEAYRRDIDEAVKKIQKPLNSGLLKAASPYIESPEERLARKRAEDAQFFGRGGTNGANGPVNRIPGGFPGIEGADAKYNEVLKKEIAEKERQIAVQRAFFDNHLVAIKESLSKVKKGTDEEAFLIQAYNNTLKDKIKFEASLGGIRGKSEDNLRTPKPTVATIDTSKMTAEQRSQYYYSQYQKRTEGGDDDFGTGNKQEAAEKERLRVLQENINAHKKYTNALKIAAEKGFGIQDLKNVYNRGTDIDRLQFAKKDEYGVKQNLDLYTNNAGKVTPGISNQFRSFGQGVVRDIGELTKWSIALAAVYGPLNKLKELTQEMIANQSKLAEATVSVNSSFLDQSKIFDIAADAANASGEAVTGVIDAFTQAFRATGGGSDQVERLATAQQLLSDSLILSKLSTLDQASAIDTLSAALRQSGRGLNEGTELLDSWVRVTKVANVDLTTLATGFAVLGDAAESAGISADELNGIIAAIAETGISSGKETANIARSIVSGFQSDQARRELEALGIAVEDTTGTMRPFLDVMGEIYNLRQNKIIDDTQFSRLTLALGGGTRRQAAYSSFIENFDRVFAVAKESEEASGDAQAALAKQLETVQTALDRLGNAFSSLAQTMGTEGGFLGIITKSVDTMTNLVNIFEGLVGVLGKATPALAAFIATSLLLKSRGTGSIQEALSGLAEGLQGGSLEEARLDQIGKIPQPGPGAAGLAATPQRKSPYLNILGSNNLSSGIAQGIGVSLIPALLNATNKDDRFGGTKAGADVFGGIAGGLLGSLTPLGPIIGASIGTAIAEVFINKTVAYTTDVFKYSTPETTVGTGTVAKTDEDRLKALQEAEIGLFKSVGFGSEALGRFLSSGGISEKVVERLNTAIKERDEGTVEQIIRAGGAQEVGLTPDALRKAYETGSPLEYNPESDVYAKASDASKKIYDSALSAYKASQETDTDVSTPFGSLVAENRQQYAGLLDSLKESSRKDVSSQRLAGDLKGSEYARRTSAIEGFDTKALNYYSALGEEFIKVNKGVDDATEAFEAFNQIIVTGSADTIPEITSIVAEVQNLINLLGDPVLNSDALKAFGGAEGAREKLASLQNTGANLLNDVYNQSTLSTLKVPNIQGDINKPLSENDFGEMITKYNELEKKFYQDYLGFTQEQVDIVTAGFEAWAQVVGESGDVFFKKVSETDPALWQQAMAELMEEGKLESQKTTPFGIQQLDMTSQEGAGLQGQIDYFSQYLAENFAQYQQNPEEFGVIFSDYVTDVLHGDNLAVQLALQGLNDKAQKQLDGQYNIPEGATFWVPLTAAYYRPQSEGAGMGTGSIDTAPLDNSAENLDQAALNLSQAADLFKESQMRGQQIAEGMNAGGKVNDRGPQSAGGLRYQEGSRRLAEERLLLQRQRQGGLDLYRQSESQSSRDSGNNADVSIMDGKYGRDYGTFIETLKQTLLQILSGAASVSPGYGMGGDIGGGSRGGIGGRIPDTSVNAAQTAKLDIRFESTTQLMVDGRVLATIIKPHLASDLLRLEGSQGTVTKRYVI